MFASDCFSTVVYQNADNANIMHMCRVQLSLSPLSHSHVKKTQIAFIQQYFCGSDEPYASV